MREELVPRVRIAFIEVQRMLGTSFYFDISRDDTITGNDGAPALHLVEPSKVRGSDDPLAFTVRVSVAQHEAKFPAGPTASALRSGALHEILHAFRSLADTRGEYRLRSTERIAYWTAQENATYAEERAFAPLINAWFEPLPGRLWHALFPHSIRRGDVA